MFEITTERLAMRPLAADDADALHALWTDEPARRFLWDGEVIPRESTREVVEKSVALFDRSGYGLWAVRQHDSPALLGIAGYWHFRTPPALELLFAVAASHWGRGIATESSRGVIRYGFERLGFQAIVASTDAANRASIRVMEKLGMAFRRRESADGLHTIFYELGRSDRACKP